MWLFPPPLYLEAHSGKPTLAMSHLQGSPDFLVCHFSLLTYVYLVPQNKKKKKIKKFTKPDRESCRLERNKES